jgi:hypothetical protein
MYSDGLAYHARMVGKLLDGELTVGQSKSASTSIGIALCHGV